MPSISATAFFGGNLPHLQIRARGDVAERPAQRLDQIGQARQTANAS